MALVTNYVAEMTRFFFEGTGERIAIRDRSPLIKADLSSRRTRNKKKKKRKKEGGRERERKNEVSFSCQAISGQVTGPVNSSLRDRVFRSLPQLDLREHPSYVASLSFRPVFRCVNSTDFSLALRLP